MSSLSLTEGGATCVINHKLHVTQTLGHILSQILMHYMVQAHICQHLVGLWHYQQAAGAAIASTSAADADAPVPKKRRGRPRKTSEGEGVASTFGDSGPTFFMVSH